MAGQLIQKSDNRWLLRIYEGRNPITDKRAYKSIIFRGDKEQAQAELDRLVALRKQETTTKHGSITVSEHFDQWFVVVAENRYTPNTQENYGLLFRLYVQPIIGHINLSDLQAQQVQMIFSAMSERELSTNTRRKVYSMIATVFDCAVAWETIKTNPMARVEIPRREVKEMRAMSREEAGSFLSVTDEGPHREFFRTALVTGMRPGELFGLRWDDIDFEGCTISIQRSIVWIRKKSNDWTLVPPKTTRGRRQITVSKALVLSLSELRKRQDFAKRTYPNYHDHAFVFATKSGRPWRRTTFATYIFKKALASAGLPRTIRLYDLRHTNATLLLKDGEHIKVVSERLGHANINITLEIYAHVLPGMQRDAADRMANLLGDPKHTAGTP